MDAIQKIKELIAIGNKRTTRQGIFVSLLTLGVASFMLSLYWLDPGLSHETNTIKVLYFLFVALFFAVGFLMLYFAFWGFRKKSELFLHRLQYESTLILKASHLVIHARGAPKSKKNFAVGAQHYLKIEYAGGKSFQLAFSPSQIDEILKLISEKASHIQINRDVSAIMLVPPPV